MAQLIRMADVETRLRSVGHSLGLVIGAFAVGFILALTAAQTLFSLGFSFEADRVVFVVASSVFQFLGFYVALYWYFDRLGDADALLHLRGPSLRAAGWVLGGVVVLLGTNFVISELLVNVGLEGAQNEIIRLGREEPVLFLYLVPVTILFVAPAEELLFRGAVQGLFRQAWGVLPAVLLASGLFAVAHYLALGADGSRLVTIGVIFVLGLILATVYELSESILVSAAVHAGWNVIVFAWEYAAVTGLV